MFSSVSMFVCAPVTGLKKKKKKISQREASKKYFIKIKIATNLL